MFYWKTFCLDVLFKTHMLFSLCSTFSQPLLPHIMVPAKCLAHTDTNQAHCYSIYAHCRLHATWDPKKPQILHDTTLIKWFPPFSLPDSRLILPMIGLWHKFFTVHLMYLIFVPKTSRKVWRFLPVRFLPVLWILSLTFFPFIWTSN